MPPLAANIQASLTLDSLVATDLTVTQPDNAAAVTITKSGAGSGTAVTIDNDGTGTGLNIQQGGNGSAVYVQKTASGVGVPFLIDNGGTDACLQLNSSSTGKGIFVNNDANAISIDIDSEATSLPLINLAAVVGNSRGDIAFGTSRSSDPSSASEGDIWYDSTNHVFKYHNGTGVTTLATA